MTKRRVVDPQVVDEAKRDDQGRWLPGRSAAWGRGILAEHPEKRASVIESLLSGEDISQAADAAGVSERTIWRAMTQDEEIRQAYVSAESVRRWRMAREIGRYAEDVVAMAQKELATASAKDRRDSAVAIGTLLDGHAKAAGLAGASGQVHIRLAASENMLAADIKTG